LEKTIMANILPNTDKGLIAADNAAVVFIDHQPQMIFGVANIERQQLINNVVLLAKGAKEFGVPAVLTAVETESFSGYIWPQLMDVFPGKQPIERTSMNSWAVFGTFLIISLQKVRTRESLRIGVRKGGRPEPKFRALRAAGLNDR
jgi:hypothetical protein